MKHFTCVPCQNASTLNDGTASNELKSFINLYKGNATNVSKRRKDSLAIR